MASAMAFGLSGAASAAAPDALPEFVPGVAGYVADFTGRTHVVATIIMPELHCDPDVEEGIATKVSVGAPDGQLKAGIEFSSHCHRGQPSWRSYFYTADGYVATGDIEGGDRIKVTEKAPGNRGTVVMTADNKTKGWSATATTFGSLANQASIRQYHLVILNEDPLILSENTTVRGVRIAGEDLADLHPTRSKIVDDGEVLMKASRIRHGHNFTFKYLGSQP